MVIDGRRLTWEQFGEALSAYEGWNFRLAIEDRVAEAQTETAAEVVNIARHRSRPGPLS